MDLTFHEDMYRSTLHKIYEQNRDFLVEIKNLN